LQGLKKNIYFTAPNGFIPPAMKKIAMMELLYYAPNSNNSQAARSFHSLAVSRGQWKRTAEGYFTTPGPASGQGLPAGRVCSATG
jgi:hypothetical protein